MIFEWRHNGERERIVEQIHGGVAGDGFRTYSRKLQFPEDAGGLWTVDVLTPQEAVAETFAVSRRGFVKAVKRDAQHWHGSCLPVLEHRE